MATRERILRVQVVAVFFDLCKYSNLGKRSFLKLQLAQGEFGEYVNKEKCEYSQIWLSTNDFGDRKSVV